jgi:hypothetical protein
MTYEEYISAIEKYNLKDKDIIFISWGNKTASCTIRLLKVQPIKEDDNFLIAVGYYTFPWNLSSIRVLRKATLFDKLFRHYDGNSFDNSPFS